MAELTHDEWAFIDDSTLFDCIDDVDKYKHIMEKLHPGPYLDCRECFKRCEGRYPGEPHHVSNNQDCPMFQDIAEFNAHFEAKDDAWFDAHENEEIRPCDCNCTCMGHHH